MTPRPAWVQQVSDALATIKGEDLTLFLPPDDGSARSSAVLVLLADGPDGPDLLLTERSHTMRSHPGQVSFPGGTVDEGETPQETALREANEEVGLEPHGVDVLGQMPALWLPPSNFAVTPVVAFWRDPHAVHAVSPEEVHAVYRVPVSELAQPENRIVVKSPIRDYRMPGFLIGPDHDVILWGFTGGVVERFLTYLGWIQPMPDAPEVDLPAYMLSGRERNGRRDPEEWRGGGQR